MDLIEFICLVSGQFIIKQLQTYSQHSSRPPTPSKLWGFMAVVGAEARKVARISRHCRLATWPV